MGRHEHIRFHVDNDIAWLQLNRPEAANAYTDDMVAEMTRALDDLRRLVRIRLPSEVAATEVDGECARSDRPRRTIRYVDRVSEDENRQAPGGCGRNGKLILDSLLTGSGPRMLVVGSAVPGRFCAGADLHEIRNRRAVDGGTIPSLVLFDRLEALPVPTVAAIDGPAVAGGLELALACDLRIGSPRARFSLPETKLGILPAAGATWRLPRLIGQQRARAMVLFGQELEAAQALAVGLISELVPEEQLRSRVEALGAQVRERDPLATTLAREALNETLQSREGREVVSRAQTRLYGRQAKEQDD